MEDKKIIEIEVSTTFYEFITPPTPEFNSETEVLNSIWKAFNLETFITKKVLGNKVSELYSLWVSNDFIKKLIPTLRATLRATKELEGDKNFSMDDLLQRLWDKLEVEKYILEEINKNCHAFNKNCHACREGHSQGHSHGK